MFTRWNLNMLTPQFCGHPRMLCFVANVYTNNPNPQSTSDCVLISRGVEKYIYVGNVSFYLLWETHQATWLIPVSIACTGRDDTLTDGKCLWRLRIVISLWRKHLVLRMHERLLPSIHKNSSFGITWLEHRSHIASITRALRGSQGHQLVATSSGWDYSYPRDCRHGDVLSNRPIPLKQHYPRRGGVGIRYAGTCILSTVELAG